MQPPSDDQTTHRIATACGYAADEMDWLDKRLREAGKLLVATYPAGEAKLACAALSAARRTLRDHTRALRLEEKTRKRLLTGASRAGKVRG